MKYKNFSITYLVDKNKCQKISVSLAHYKIYDKQLPKGIPLTRKNKQKIKTVTPHKTEQTFVFIRQLHATARQLSVYLCNEEIKFEERMGRTTALAS